jgi:hypothetical protein
MSAPPAQACLQGLGAREAAERLLRDGPNELPRTGGRKLWRILRDILTEPMFGMLLGAGMIYLLLGDRDRTRAEQAKFSCPVSPSRRRGRLPAGAVQQQEAPRRNNRLSIQSPFSSVLSGTSWQSRDLHLGDDGCAARRGITMRRGDIGNLAPRPCLGPRRRLRPEMAHDTGIPGSPAG